MSLPNPSDKVLREMNAMFYNLMWKEKPDKVSRILMSQKYSDGGVKIIDIYTHCQSFRISLIKRIVKGSIESNLLCLPTSSLPKHDFVIDMGMIWVFIVFVNFRIKRITSFGAKCFFSRLQCCFCVLTTKKNNISSQPIWNNTYIK